MYELVKNEIAQTRLEICKSCEAYSLSVCRKCGCITFAKVKFANSICPMNKW